MGSLAANKKNFFYNLEHFGIKLSQKEIREMIITGLVIGFVTSFNNWGVDGGSEFSALWGIGFFVFSTLSAFFLLIATQIGPRLVAIYYGYDPEYSYSIIGLAIGVIVMFASRGDFSFFLPGLITVKHLAASRLGEFRYYTSDWEWVKAIFLAPFSSLLLACFFSFSRGFFAPDTLVFLLLDQLMWISIYFSWFYLIPLVGNVGIILFYPNIHFWLFCVGLVVTCSLLLLLPPPFGSPLIALGTGLIMGIVLMVFKFASDMGYSG